MAIALSLVALAADAACTRERGAEILRMFEKCSDGNGKRVSCPLPTKPPSLDKEYIPKPGMTGKIGPYEWTIVDKRRTGVLSHNGKKLLESDFCIGGKYPWLVGLGYEESDVAKRKELSDNGILPKDEYSGVYYYFAIDMRDDHIEYIPFEKRDDICRITGMSAKSYNLEDFWGYFLSKRGPERLAKLEAALKTPADAEK